MKQMMIGQNNALLTEIDINTVIAIAIDAGKAIMEVYNGDFEVQLKEDQSPLTLADQLAHQIISAGLSILYPDIPVLSEEGSKIDYTVRKDWKQYWCVDPLDGTKEFINRNGEFTVNIALMQDNKPVIGVIYAPVLDVVYYGIVNQGCFKMTPGKKSEPTFADKDTNEWVAIGSRSHASESETEYLKQFQISSKTAIGSSLKFCLIAEGKAHIYYRSGPTMEWDTAAGQAIALASGALMYDTDGNEFPYNKPSLLNGGFVCKAK